MILEGGGLSCLPDGSNHPLQRSMKLKTAFFNVLAITSACCPGCGPQLDPEDLGTVIFEVPKVPGADEPYPLPEPKQRSADRGDALRPPVAP